MIRLILFSLICIAVFYVRYLFKYQLRRILQRADSTKVHLYTDIKKTKGTLVHDPYTGEYYVQ
ncbi:hypothetical protein [Bartonella bacilliformis]|uniref:Uncharacterized protein n=1 Tax=Bartonella bacilliformis Ver097 TaxID=1293911 RepID=A0A072R2M8_BARBA|nr:hypothetical protein [Bartonella bacilliformis]KEG19906.1 hypothetical protein H710_00500 [Bartonella bacilliformis Ver097]